MDAGLTPLNAELRGGLQRTVVLRQDGTNAFLVPKPRVQRFAQPDDVLLGTGSGQARTVTDTVTVTVTVDEGTITVTETETVTVTTDEGTVTVTLGFGDPEACLLVAEKDTPMAIPNAFAGLSRPSLCVTSVKCPWPSLW